MAGTQRLLAMAMAFLLGGNSGGGNADALGMVVLAEHAKLGSQATTEGTTIYDGDRLSPDAEGSLRLLVGDAIVDLPKLSCVMMHKGASEAAKEFGAELVSGSVVLSVKAASEAEVVAFSARVRSMAAARGVVEVGIVGPRELLVFARRGPAQISYHGETETIEEGKSYRVLLNDSDDNPPGSQGAKKSGKRNKTLLLIIAGATAAGGVAALWGGGKAAGAGVESPDRP
ncbi:MAG: hypothetical protein WAN65_31445 [Candidatus Sulfotelmatobacter sp.]